MNYLPPQAPSPIRYVPMPVAVPVRHKSAGVALLISFLLPPGFAHLYLNRLAIALVLFLAWCFGLLITLTIVGAVLGIPMMVAAWTFGIIHSAVTAPGTRTGPRGPLKRRNGAPTPGSKG